VTTAATLEAVELYRRAADEFTSRARTIAGRWSGPTPCAGWDVRALVRHVVEEESWMPPLLAGSTIAEVGDALAGDLLGDDPLRALLAASASADAAVAADGAMERTVHLSFGDVPGREYAMQVAADHLVHAWDLARAVGGDTRLDPAAVVAVRAWFASNEQAYRDAGLIGPRPPMPPDAGPQEELLVMYGRTP
jgi:uncharacterized protein (TIGR03086 family)